LPNIIKIDNIINVILNRLTVFEALGGAATPAQTHPQGNHSHSRASLTLNFRTKITTAPKTTYGITLTGRPTRRLLAISTSLKRCSRVITPPF